MSLEYTLEHYKLANRMFNRAETNGTLKPAKIRVLLVSSEHEEQKIFIYETRPEDYLAEAHALVLKRRERYSGE